MKLFNYQFIFTPNKFSLKLFSGNIHKKKSTSFPEAIYYDDTNDKVNGSHTG